MSKPVTDKNIDRRKRALDLTVLIAWATLFTLMPFAVSGIPLWHQLSSDAEWYAAVSAMTLDPHILTADQSFTPDAKPSGERLVQWVFVHITDGLGLSLLQGSIVVSYASLIVFVCGIYMLTRYALGNSRYAFMVASFTVIPIHVLGGTTFGFQALGFLPRDFALSFLPIVLLLYCYAIRQPTPLYLILTYFVCGMLTNLYVLLFPHLFVTLLLAEVIRTHRIGWIYVVYGGAFGLGAVPAIVDVLGRVSAPTPIDLAIMQLRHSYMMVGPFMESIGRYLRRFIIYTVVVATLWFLVRRYGTDEEKDALRPWFSIVAGAFIIAVIGVYIESTTVHAKYFLSRTSLFLTLGAMMICCVGVEVTCRQWMGTRARAVAMAVVAGIFLLQSNLPSVYRLLRDSHATSEQRQRFLTAVERLKVISGIHDVVLAPSEIQMDMAASLRTYALRPIYVSEKDGGVSMLDGERGRKWLKRYRTLQEVLSSSDAGPLLRLMRDERIAYAFLPETSPPAQDKAIQPYVVANAEGFLIVRAVSTP